MCVKLNENKAKYTRLALTIINSDSFLSTIQNYAEIEVVKRNSCTSDSKNDNFIINVTAFHGNKYRLYSWILVEYKQMYAFTFSY